MRNLTEWTLREKIGQMVMCGFDGKEPTEGIRMLIRDYRLGGVIYFRRNVGTAAETAALSAELQRMAAEVSDVPLWIAVDQEGGMVARIDQDVTVMPGNMALGAGRDAALAHDTALACAADLRRMGININFAPCLDVNNNAANPVIGVRSYGERPELVAELGAAVIRGYQAGGVAACAKHFPGHGDTVADSHYELPVVPHDRERLERVELVPFRAAVKAEADAIMTAHVRFPAHEDTGLPATLSSKILTGLLRDRLGFAGMIVTDCLEMKAISDTVGIGRGAVMAVKAGADLVLVSHRLDRQLEALEALHEAVQSGEIEETRIDDAVRRILAIKERRLGKAAVVADGSNGVQDAAEVSGASGAVPGAGGVVGEFGGVPDAVKISGGSNGVSDAVEIADGSNGVQDLAKVSGGSNDVSEDVVPVSGGSNRVPDAEEVARRASERAVTVVKNEGGVLPLRRETPTLAVWPEVRRSTEVDEAIRQDLTLGKALGRHLAEVREIVIGAEPSAEEIERVLEEARSGRYGQIVVGTYNAAFAPGQRTLMEALLEVSGVKVTAVALRNPYDLLQFPDVPAYAACYENRPLMMEALAAVLAGIRPAQGRLPVTVSEAYPYGHGLTLGPNGGDRQ